MLNSIYVLPFVVSTITSVGEAYLGTFLYPFVSGEVLVCLGFKGCVALPLSPNDNWDTPSLVVNVQTQGLRNKTRAKIGPEIQKISFSASCRILQDSQNGCYCMCVF